VLQEKLLIKMICNLIQMITKTTRVMQRTLIIKKKLQKEKLLVLKGEFRQLELVIQDQNQQVVGDFNWLELCQI